ncbi:hypothetical protein [Streptomyces sp. NPDC002215]|uniref:hypothetical protein n=1 Tax=Streptomyces sp. NPDC002215 TaxID=3154412 RepID=UPI00333122FE
MGYELYYKGHITFDRPVSLARPDEPDLFNLTRFFNPLLLQRAEGTTSSRYVTGFQVDQENAEWAKSWPWSEDFAAIEDFARRHLVTLTAQLRWQGDGCPPNPADDRGHVVFDLHGQHHQVPDSSNGQAAEAHRRRTCTCYRDPAPRPTPAPAPTPTAASVHPTVGPLTPIRSGQLTDYAAHCTDHGQIVFTPDENLARALRNEHIARHHS